MRIDADDVALFDRGHDATALGDDVDDGCGSGRRQARERDDALGAGCHDDPGGAGSGDGTGLRVDGEVDGRRDGTGVGEQYEARLPESGGPRHQPAVCLRFVA